MDKNEIRKLIDELNRLTTFYNKGASEISDKDWDDLYFKLQSLEKETGIIYPDSPTQSIYFEKVSQLKKVRHTHPMLSLDKTKNIEDIKKFASGHDWVGMFKLDGLSCSLVYINGYFNHADTRGNGEIGEDITHNIRTIKNIPLKIDTDEAEVVIDGEILCTFANFKSFESEYKNPRNFAAGSIRLLDAQECARRNLSFVAWDLIQGCSTEDNFMWRLEQLDEWGFDTVPRVGDVENIEDAINCLNNFKSTTDYPLDGYVFRFNSQKYYNNLGATAHHFNGAMAYKFYDETYITTLRNIEWTMGRTGVLTPVAIFDEVDTGDSIVSRANLHNISIMKELYPHQWCTGMKLEIYLANMIIPQVKSVSVPETHANRLDPPSICPLCGGATEIRQINNSKELICTNPDCEGKFINKLDYFCGKKGLDIKGISKATLEKLINWGWIGNIEEIFSLSNFRDEWITKSGFGIKSVDKILQSIEDAKNTTLDAFISAIGIPLIGRTVAKDLINYFETYEDFRAAVDDPSYDFSVLNNFGFEMNKSLKTFNYKEADRISKILIFKAPIVNNEKRNNNLEGKTIVITGKLANFKNRAELKSVIESCGGKVVDSISSKTDMLINNDINSASAKNKAVQARNIPIITEAAFMQQYIDN